MGGNAAGKTLSPLNAARQPAECTAGTLLLLALDAAGERTKRFTRSRNASWFADVARASLGLGCFRLSRWRGPLELQGLLRALSVRARRLASRRPNASSAAVDAPRG